MMQAQQIPNVPPEQMSPVQTTTVTTQHISSPLRRLRVKNSGFTFEYMESFKNSEGKYQCSSCERSYLHFKHLKRHFMKHTGNRPHVCNICQDTFCRSDILKRHYARCLNRFKVTGKRSSVSRVPKRVVPTQFYSPVAPISYQSFSSQAPAYSQSVPSSQFSYYPTPGSQGFVQPFFSSPSPTLTATTYAFPQLPHQQISVPQLKSTHPILPPPNFTSIVSQCPSSQNVINQNPGTSPSSRNVVHPYSAYQAGPAGSANIYPSPTETDEIGSPTSGNQYNAFYSGGQGLAIYQSDGKSLPTLGDPSHQTSGQTQSVNPDLHQMQSMNNIQHLQPMQQTLPPPHNLTPPATATSPITPIFHGSMCFPQYSTFYPQSQPQYPRNNILTPTSFSPNPLSPTLPSSSSLSRTDSDSSFTDAGNAEADNGISAQPAVNGGYPLTSSDSHHFQQQHHMLPALTPQNILPPIFSNPNVPSPPTTASSPDSCNPGAIPNMNENVPAASAYGYSSYQTDQSSPTSGYKYSFQMQVPMASFHSPNTSNGPTSGTSTTYLEL